MYACLQLSLPPPASPPSHTLIVCPNACTVPQCMPVARLGLIHHTMPSLIRTPFSKSLVNVWVRGMLSGYVYTYHQLLYNHWGFKITAIMKCGTVIIMQAVYCLIVSVKKKIIVSLSTKYRWLVNLLRKTVGVITHQNHLNCLLGSAIMSILE